jgi:hypothetical protein
MGTHVCKVTCAKCHETYTIPITAKEASLTPPTDVQCANCIKLGIAPPGMLVFVVTSTPS